MAPLERSVSRRVSFVILMHYSPVMLLPGILLLVKCLLLHLTVLIIELFAHLLFSLLAQLLPSVEPVPLIIPFVSGWHSVRSIFSLPIIAVSIDYLFVVVLATVLLFDLSSSLPLLILSAM